MTLEYLLEINTSRESCRGYLSDVIIGRWGEISRKLKMIMVLLEIVRLEVRR